MRRPRYYHFAGRVVWVAVLRCLALLALAAFGVCFISVMLTRDVMTGYLALGCLSVFAFCRITAFFESGKLGCPLCHGPVIQSRSCHKHPQARRLPLLGHLGTVVFDVLVRWSFRCMYCGTDFRLRK